jgi:hypothetical protein
MTDATSNTIITAAGGIIVAVVTGIFMKLSHVDKNVNGNLAKVKDELAEQRAVVLALTGKLNELIGFNRGAKEQQEKDR